MWYTHVLGTLLGAVGVAAAQEAAAREGSQEEGSHTCCAQDEEQAILVALPVLRPAGATLHVLPNRLGAHALDLRHSPPRQGAAGWDAVPVVA